MPAGQHSPSHHGNQSEVTGLAAPLLSGEECWAAVPSSGSPDSTEHQGACCLHRCPLLPQEGSPGHGACAPAHTKSRRGRLDMHWVPAVQGLGRPHLPGGAIWCRGDRSADDLCASLGFHWVRRSTHFYLEMDVQVRGARVNHSLLLPLLWRVSFCRLSWATVRGQ